MLGGRTLMMASLLDLLEKCRCGVGALHLGLIAAQSTPVILGGSLGTPEPNFSLQGKKHVSCEWLAARAGCHAQSL